MVLKVTMRTPAEVYSITQHGDQMVSYFTLKTQKHHLYYCSKNNFLKTEMYQIPLQKLKAEYHYISVYSTPSCLYVPLINLI